MSTDLDFVDEDATVVEIAAFGGGGELLLLPFDE